jgi:cell division protein FtsL
MDKQMDNRETKTIKRKENSTGLEKPETMQEENFRQKKGAFALINKFNKFSKQVKIIILLSAFIVLIFFIIFLISLFKSPTGPATFPAAEVPVPTIVNLHPTTAETKDELDKLRQEIEAFDTEQKDLLPPAVNMEISL